MTISNPRDIVSLLTSVRKKRQEHFGVILLDAARNVICKKVLFIGSDNRSLVSTRVIFWYACEKKANSMIIFHNHPSGTLEPSSQDFESTNVIYKACEIMGIALLDHIIVTKNDYFSFIEHDLLYSSTKSTKSVAE